MVAEIKPELRNDNSIFAAYVTGSPIRSKCINCGKRIELNGRGKPSGWYHVKTSEIECEGGV